MDSSAGRWLVVVANTAGCDMLIGQSFYMHIVPCMSRLGSVVDPSLAENPSSFAILRTYSPRRGSEKAVGSYLAARNVDLGQLVCQVRPVCSSAHGSLLFTTKNLFHDIGHIPSRSIHSPLHEHGRISWSVFPVSVLLSSAFRWYCISAFLANWSKCV